MKTTGFIAAMAVIGLLGCGGGSEQNDAAPQQDGGGKLIGEACGTNGQCVSKQCLTDEIAYQLLTHEVYTYGGYCIHFPCDPALNDADCGEGAHCFNGQAYGADMWICLKTCDSGQSSACGRFDDAGVPNYECFQDLANIPDGGSVSAARWGCIPVGLIQFDGGT
jgi:hypothetical protein